MSTDRNLRREFMDLFGDLPILVGLRQQGHMPTVEGMLAEGRTWEEIGKAIGWDGKAAERWYALETLPIEKCPAHLEPEPCFVCSGRDRDCPRCCGTGIA